MTFPCLLILITQITAEFQSGTVNLAVITLKHNFAVAVCLRGDTDTRVLLYAIDLDPLSLIIRIGVPLDIADSLQSWRSLI